MEIFPTADGRYHMFVVIRKMAIFLFLWNILFWLYAKKYHIVKLDWKPVTEMKIWKKFNCFHNSSFELSKSTQTCNP